MKNRPTPRVLIADAALLRNEMFVQAFRNEDFLCEVASNGTEATDLLSKLEFDMIITNSNLPNLESVLPKYDFLHVMTQPALFVFTDVIDESLRDELIMLGVDFVECKPVDYALYALWIREVLVCKYSLIAIDECNKISHEDDYFGNACGFATDSLELTDEHNSRILLYADTFEETRQIVCNPESYLSDIAAVILGDLQLANEILVLANSAHYNPGGATIDRLEQAILRIGQCQLEEMILRRSKALQQGSSLRISKGNLKSAHA